MPPEPRSEGALFFADCGSGRFDDDHLAFCIFKSLAAVPVGIALRLTTCAASGLIGFGKTPSLSVSVGPAAGQSRHIFIFGKGDLQVSENQKKTISIYQNLMNANAMIHGFRTGHRVGVFASLREGQKTAQELAAELQLAERPLHLLLNQLCQTGYVENYGDDFALSVLGKMLPDQFADLGESYWSGLEHWIRTGEKQVAEDQPLDETPFGIESMAFDWMWTPNAMDLIEALNIGKSRAGMRVIELYCGSGIFGSAMGYHDKQMKVTFVDSEAQVGRARKTAESIEIQDRCQFIAADPKSFAPKFRADLVVIANCCKFLDDLDLQLLLRNAARCLDRKGEIAVIGQFSENDTARFANATEAIVTEMRTSRGKLRTRKEMIDLLYESGFCDAMYSELNSPPATNGVIVAGVTAE